MRGCVKAAFSLLLLLSFSQPSFSQCNFSPRSSGVFRTSMLDLAVDGGDLWAATGYGVQLFDRTVDPPALVASIPLPDTTRVVRVSGGLVYAGSGTNLFVLRKNGRAIEIVRTVAAGGTVNDLAIQTVLFAATSNGIAHFTLIDPTNPTRTNATLATSSANVTSLSIAGSRLYAADGDASVETFTISLPSQPQKTGTLDSLPRSIAVNATSTRVYVSDGQNTDVFVNDARVARTPFGSTSFAAIGSDEHFLAGTELAVHAVDFSVGNTPVELFEQQLPATAGTINRVNAMQLSGNRLYVAAGDAGLITLDTTAFARPFPVRSLGNGTATSTAISGTTVYATPSAGGISESTASGNFLTFNRTTNSDRPWTLFPAHGLAFPAVSGSRVLLLSQNIAVNFAKTVISAITNGATIWAVLEDNTLWSAPVTADATPQQIPLAFKPLQVVRDQGAAALVELTSEGTTKIHYFPDTDFSKAPQRTFTINGAPIGNVDLYRTAIALATFQGISYIDLTSASTTTFPDSNTVLPKQFTLAGTKLLELTDRSLLVWDPATKKLSREILLPADAIAMDANETLAAIATTDGVTTVSYDAPQRLPQLLATRNGNRYYTKAVASDDRLYVIGESGIDIYATTVGDAPQFVSGLRANGFVDLAASDDYLFTIAGNATVTVYGRDGNVIRQATITDGAESRPLGIVSVGGAPWVALATNCASGICRDKKTLVLDPLSLAVTSSMSGGVFDAVSNGARAYAVFDIPSVVRVLSINDPLHPAQLAERTLDAAANTVAYSAGTVYVAGTQVLAFNETALSPVTSALKPLATGAIDRVRFDGGCAVITHRTVAPELHPASGTPTALTLPSPVRWLTTQPGRIFFLTDHSIEVWSTSAAPKPSKRRATH